MHQIARWTRLRSLSTFDSGTWAVAWLEVMKELLKNAVLSIELGVEDFRAEDERRLLSSIRNLYAGVLLLCKQVLWTASPAGSEGSLIYKDLVPEYQGDGSVIMKPKKAHRNTVDRRMIEDRFKSLGFDLDWDRLNTLAGIRNDTEHLFLKATPVTAREALASAMPLIERLLVDHLEEDPTSLFEDGIWPVLLENSEVFEQQADRCRKTFDDVTWSADILPDAVRHLRCPSCGSSLVRCIETVDMDFDSLWLECAECGQDIEREEAFEKAFQEINVKEAYRVAKDGDLPSIAQCPECHRLSWSRGDRRCVFCDEQSLKCNICGTECDPEDYDSEAGLCSSCSWGMQKAMRDD